MYWMWESIFVALMIVAVGIYAALRYLHVVRLRQAARDTVHLPPANVLSWSTHVAGKQVVPTVTKDGQPREIATPTLPSPDTGGKAATAAENNWHAGMGAATLDTGIASFSSLRDLAAIDWSVAEGIKLSAAANLDLNRWSNLRDYIDVHYFDVGEPVGFLNRLVGYVGEAKAGDYFDALGSEVEFNDAPNVPGYDLIVNGDQLQVKVGGAKETFDTHFEKYPDIPVVTGTDNFSVVPEGVDVTFLDSLDAEQIRAATEDSLDIVHDDFDAGGPIMPVVTAIRSSLEQIGILKNGHTNLSTAAKNIGLDAAGVGIGGWGGGYLGFLAGSPLGPVGMVSGAFLGRLAGSMGGRILTNVYKYKDFNASREAYNKALVDAQKSIDSRQLEAHAFLACEVMRQQDDLKKYIKVLQSKLKRKLQGCHHWQESRCIDFVTVFPKVLARVEMALRIREQSELSAYTRSSCVRRLLWPRLTDMKYCIVHDSFRQRMQAVATAKQEFDHLVSTTPTEVTAWSAVSQIENFVHNTPFESPDFDHVCKQLRQMMELARTQECRLKQQADLLARSEYARRVAAVRKQLQEVAREMSEFVGEQAKAVKLAKDQLTGVARKVGIDLESQRDTNSSS